MSILSTISKDAIPDGYLLVRRPEPSPTPAAPAAGPPSKSEKEEKKSTPSASLVRLLQRPTLMRNMLSTSRGPKSNKPFRIWSTYSNSATGATGTGLTATISVMPSLTVDWGDISPLFDEVRVVRTRIHYYVRHTLSTNAVIHALAYDPCDSSSFALIDAALQAPKHLLAVVPAVGTSQVFGPQPMSPTGFYTLESKVRSDNVRSTAVGTALAGGWMSTSDSSDVWGYWKFISNAPSTGTTVTLTYYVSMELELRARQ